MLPAILAMPGKNSNVTLGIDFDTWLEGFDCVESSVKDSVEMLRKHPLIPKDVKISGYVMDSVTGELHVVEP